MQSLAFTSDRDYYTRAANEDCANGGPRTRTKYEYDAQNRLHLAGQTGLLEQFEYDASDRITMSAQFGAYTYGAGMIKPTHAPN